MRPQRPTPRTGERRPFEDDAPVGDPRLSHFEHDLDIELLRSERLRTAILAGLFAFGAVFACASAAFFRFRDLPGLGNRTPGIAAAIVFATMAAWELGMLRLIGARMRAGRTLPRWLPYWNAVVEISLPTALIYVGARDLSDPLVALSAPPLFVYILFIILAALRLDFRTPAFAGFLAALQYILLARHYVVTSGPQSGLPPVMLTPFFYAQRSVVFILTGLVAGFVAREMRRRLSETMAAAEQRNEVLRVFGQQTSPTIVEELLSGRADAATRRAHVCVMFLDLRGFTAYSESREPEDVVAYLNVLFGFMIEIVNRHHGAVHQLLGDGFMAVFGVPAPHGNDEQNALDAALAIVERVAKEHARGTIPPTRVGIGIHAGSAVVGTVGSAIHKEYKVTGDTVNVAARIEQMNKRFDSRILVSNVVWQSVCARDVVAVERGEVDVRGREEPVGIWQLA